MNVEFCFVAAIEHQIADACHVIADCNVFQSCTAVERILANPCHAVADGDACQSIAPSERIVADACFYIGEWHTHHEDNPTPSAIDYNSIEDNYQSASLVVPFLLMIIAGTESFHMSIYNGDKSVKVEPKVVKKNE